MNTHLTPNRHGKCISLLFDSAGNIRPGPRTIEVYKAAKERIASLPDVVGDQHPDRKLQQRGPVADQARAINRVWKFRSSLVKCKGCDAPTTYESRNWKETEGHIYWCYTCGRYDLRVICDEETAQLIEAQALAAKRARGAASNA